MSGIHDWWVERADPHTAWDEEELGPRVAEHLEGENAYVRNGNIEAARDWRLRVVVFEGQMAHLLALAKDVR